MSIHPQQGQPFHYDVIVIGSGIAGLSFILELKKQNPQCKIALLCKANLEESNTRYAQGGIAAALSDHQDIQQHIQDTCKAGAHLCHPPSVEAILQQGPETIAFLTQQGVKFDRENQTTHALGNEGGHSKNRIYHTGDYTGAEITRALTKNIKTLPDLDIYTHHCAVNLIKQNEPHNPGAANEIVGAYILDEKQGCIHTFYSQVVILATGGAGKIYRYTTNPEVATGDGLAMAYRAGARVGNMEFYQFHPTLLYHPEVNNLLISEALRGEGAYLRLPKTQERFMQRYAPQQMELATRDIVARAIFSEIERSRFNYVYIDIRHREKSFLQKRFPRIYSTLIELGIDMNTDFIPVVPAAHYLCGGILTDTVGQTDLKRLYAIGETAFSGLHGANRLASNSLLESVVMARNSAKSCTKWLERNIIYYGSIKPWDSYSVTDLRRASQINAHWRGLRGEMTSYAGIIRTEAGLKDLLKLISVRKEMIEEYYWQHTITRDLIELRNIILVAELIVTSALQRTESRGGHYREDYPEPQATPCETILRHKEGYLHV